MSEQEQQQLDNHLRTLVSATAQQQHVTVKRILEWVRDQCSQISDDAQMEDFTPLLSVKSLQNWHCATSCGTYRALATAMVAFAFQLHDHNDPPQQQHEDEDEDSEEAQMKKRVLTLMQQRWQQAKELAEQMNSVPWFQQQQQQQHGCNCHCHCSPCQQCHLKLHAPDADMEVGYVYVMIERDTHSTATHKRRRFKLGCSNNPVRRLRTFQTANPDIHLLAVLPPIPPLDTAPEKRQCMAYSEYNTVTSCSGWHIRAAAPPNGTSSCRPAGTWQNRHPATGSID